MSRADAAGGAPRQVLREFSRSLPMLLLRAHQAVMAEFRPVLRAHGITEQQWRVLRALSTAPNLRAAALSRLTFVSGPSLTRIVKALDERGLARRRAESEDQRAASISITEAGRRLIDRVAPESEARYRSIAERIGAEDTARIYELLTRLPERLRGA